MAPGLPDIAEHFHIQSETIVAMTLSIFLITFAIGPLFLAPLSEIYGRTWVSTSPCYLSRGAEVLSGVAHRQLTLFGL